MSYVTQSSDTSREAEDLLFELYRQAGPLGRLEKAGRLSRGVARLMLERMRREHPDEPVHRLRLRILALILPREEVLAAWGWAPPAPEPARPC